MPHIVFWKANYIWQSLHGIIFFLSLSHLCSVFPIFFSALHSSSIYFFPDLLLPISS